jgi:hypothetical protein
MKPVLRYQSQLLFRRSYKPSPILRIRPATKRALVFSPVSRWPEAGSRQMTQAHSHHDFAADAAPSAREDRGGRVKTRQ